MAEKRNGRGGGGSRENECCDFCGSRRNDVELLLTSSDHRLNICNNCIAEAHKMLVAGGIIKDNGRRTAGAAA
ncbi:MAG: ATP-dependent Clp protease ATP-binding subunit ClpX, partial [Alistipes sp.]|nr:ATP-dependent Clp protease ATP-binding subunit ClpX [Alistipes sp.]